VDLIYLDYDCFQRGFDNPRQIKIQLEALACEEIFAKAERKEVKLVWSFMHEDENILCPFIDRRIEVSKIALLCELRVGPKKEIYQLAKNFQQKAKLSSKDAIHVACSCFAKSKYFLSCDDRLIKQAQKLNLEMRIMNPVEYVREVEN